MTLRADLRGSVGPLRLEIRLSLERGTLVLAGPNGSGKTTALLLLLGISRPSDGRVELDGRALFDSSRGVDVAPEQRGLGYVPQDYALFPHLTVQGNVLFGLELRLPRHEAGQRAREMLDHLGLVELAGRRPAELSGGEQQRVALARALATDPRALLLDEPLAALDAGARRSVRAYLAARLHALRIPALVVTHDPADAQALADRIAVLEDGRIVQEGSFEELRANPATPFVAHFAAGAI
jgi:molybdate transport system ATP-binding protein